MGPVAGPGDPGIPGDGQLPPGALTPVPAATRRSRSIALRRAVVKQPGRRVGRDAVARPRLGSGQDGVVECVLGQVEVAHDGDQPGQHGPAVGPVGRGQRLAHRARA